MSKRYILSKNQFKKLNSTTKELFDFLFVTKCFAENYLAEICEADSIIPLIKYMQKIADKLICMMVYIETKDEEIADIFK